MKIFKTLYEDQKERNRTYRLNGWYGLIVKILLLFVIMLMLKNITKEYIEDIFNIFNIKQSNSLSFNIQCNLKCNEINKNNVRIT